MHDVCLVLQQVVDALYDVSFPQHNFVPHGHELILHVRLQSVNEMYALVEQALEEFLFYITSVSEHFSKEHFGKYTPHLLISIVNIRACKTERYDVALVITQEMQLESVAPPHRALAVFCQAFEHLVEMASHVVAYRYHRAVSEGYACTFAESEKPHEKHHLEENPRHEFHEAVVGHRIRKVLSQVIFYEAQIVMLEVGKRAEMVTHEYRHNLAVRQLALAVSVPFAIRRSLKLQVFLQFHV